MNSERAAEIAGGLRFQYAMSNAAHDAIKDAILMACAEEREACAKICDVVGDNAVGDHEPGGAYACAKAIRGGA
jgi:hypothetical protein